MRKILFFCLVFFSNLTFAEDYNALFSSGEEQCHAQLDFAVNDEWAILWIPPSTCQLYEISNPSHIGGWSNVSDSYSCPGGGNLSSGGSPIMCIGAPDCVAPQIRNSSTKLCETPPVPPVCTAPQINDPITGACVTLPTCTGTQSAFADQCRYPDDKGPGLNCTDGSTVYPPMVCPYTLWDSFFPPPQGQSQTCRDGYVASYPDSCFDHWKVTDAQNPFGMGKAVGIVLNTMGGGGPKPVLRVAGFLNDGLPSIRAVLPLEAKINQSGLSAYASIDTSIPKISLGKAISEYIKSSPTSSYSTGITAVAAAAGMAVIINSNTGDLTPVGSTVPFSSNQIADLALRTNQSNPMPLTDIQPFINYGDVPWLDPALEAINGDFTRVYDPAGQKAPISFPNVQPGSSFVSPGWSPDQPPVATLGPDSPTQYQTPPAETPTTQPNPTLNQNPTGTDAQTSPTSSPAPGTSIDPNAVEAPPVPPTLYPDTWKYFDFLPMANPFAWDISKLLPTLPEPNCYYEIHRTFQVPYLGTKHFDIAPCIPLQPLRTVLNWAFAVLTAFICFYVVFRSSI